MSLPDDHYAVLGVPESASRDDIKAAYRRIAREVHPNAGHTGKADRFLAVYEAYRTLSDDESRRAYDIGRRASAATAATPAPPPSAAPIEAICCSVCLQPAGQPRHLVFKKVASFLFRTTTVNVQGVFCAACADTVAWKCSLFTAGFGWWGMPFGPAATVEGIFVNALGGHRDKAIDAGLAWQNAVAFSRAGMTDLALALAARLVDAEDPSVARCAREVVAASAATPRQLADPWRWRTGRFLRHMALLTAAPAALATYIAIRRYGLV